MSWNDAKFYRPFCHFFCKLGNLWFLPFSAQSIQKLNFNGVNQSSWRMSGYILSFNITKKKKKTFNRYQKPQLPKLLSLYLECLCRRFVSPIKPGSQFRLHFLSAVWVFLISMYFLLIHDTISVFALTYGLMDIFGPWRNRIINKNYGYMTEMPYCILMLYKLNGEGPVDNRPSTYRHQQFV